MNSIRVKQGPLLCSGPVHTNPFPNENGAVLLRIQLFRQRLSHKSIKAYATMPIGIMGRKILALID